MAKRGPKPTLPTGQALLDLASKKSGAEIAREYGVTRQAVSDQLRKAEANQQPAGTITTKEAAEILDKPVYTIRQWVTKGIIRATQPGGKQARLYLDRAEIEGLKIRLDSGFDPFSKPSQKGREGQDYTYMYLPISREEASQLADALPAQERAEVLRRAAREKGK